MNVPVVAVSRRLGHENVKVTLDTYSHLYPDQMVLRFPILADYALLAEGEHTVFITHGHTFNEGALPMLNPGDVLLHGHTHVPKCVEHEDYIYMNPGSTSIPKEESWHGYMTLEAGEFLWKDFDGEIKMQFHF